MLSTIHNDEDVNTGVNSITQEPVIGFCQKMGVIHKFDF